MKITKTFSRRVSLPDGDSFITTTQIEFQVEDEQVAQATVDLRKLLITEARKDIIAFYQEAQKTKEQVNGK